MGTMFTKICIILFMIIFSSQAVYANNEHLQHFNEIYNIYNEPSIAFPEFEITSGFLKDFEGTFDSSRTIIGSAPRDTRVNISLYQYDTSVADFVFLSETSLVVGSSGIFSTNIDLDLGDNYIVISAAKDSRLAARTGLIKRKELEIKLDLERGATTMLPTIILPINR